LVFIIPFLPSEEHVYYSHPVIMGGGGEVMWLFLEGLLQLEPRPNNPISHITVRAAVVSGQRTFEKSTFWVIFISILFVQSRYLGFNYEE
jgi:hypothetical protein